MDSETVWGRFGDNNAHWREIRREDGISALTIERYDQADIFFGRVIRIAFKRKHLSKYEAVIFQAALQPFGRSKIDSMVSPPIGPGKRRRAKRQGPRTGDLEPISKNGFWFKM